MNSMQVENETMGRRQAIEWHRNKIRQLLMAPVMLAVLPCAALAQPLADQGGAVEEIIVTSTRSSELLSKVPLSVTALSNAQLDQRGVRSVDDLLRIVPGVTFTRGLGPTSTVSIRGVSSNSGAATTGVYLDETPIQSRRIGQGGTTFNAYPSVFDLERVEVLRGPQGTLFGAGSQGGTIRFITPAPSLTNKSLYARSELGSTQGGDISYETGVAVGAPIKEDVLGVRLSAYFRRDGGYIDRVEPVSGNMVDRNADWQNTTVLRGALAFAPTAALKITPSVFYQKNFANTKSAFWEYLSDRDDNNYVSGSQLEEPTRDRLVVPALDMQAEFSGVVLHSNTSYLDRNTFVLQNFSNFIPAVIGYRVLPGQFVVNYPGYTSLAYDKNLQSSFTQEFRLQSADSDARLKWTIGAFYQRAEQTAMEIIPETLQVYNRLSQAAFGVDGTTRFGPLATSSEFPFAPGSTFTFINRVKSVDEQYAGFADATYKVTDKLSISAGLRVADIKFEFESYSAGPYAGNSRINGGQSERPVTPKLNLSYQADENTLFYVSTAKGFRGGGANAPLSNLCNAQLAQLGYANGTPPSFNSDTVWSYEAGTKSALLDRRVQVSGSVFLIDWSNIQQSIYLPSCGNSFVRNVGAARSKGFDLTVDVRPVPDLTLSGSVGYTDAGYTETVFGGANAAGVRATIVNEGNALTATPWIVTLGLNYEGDIAGQDTYFRVDATYKSPDSNKTPGFDPTTTAYSARSYRSPSTQLVNARAGVRINGVDVSLFANNLFNAHTSVARVNLSPIRNLVDEFAIVRPRTVGLTAAYRY